MIVIETCPKCGHDLQDIVFCTDHPYISKKCYECGWRWYSKPEQIVRRPFMEEADGQ